MTSRDSQKYAVCFAICRVKIYQMCNFASSKTYLNLAQLVVTDTFQGSLVRFSKPCSISAWRPGKINGLFVQNMVASYYSLNRASFSFLRKLFMVDDQCAGVLI